jgi:RNA polymerase-binding protein DksA
MAKGTRPTGAAARSSAGSARGAKATKKAKATNAVKAAAKSSSKATKSTKPVKSAAKAPAKGRAPTKAVKARTPARAVKVVPAKKAAKPASKSKALATKVAKAPAKKALKSKASAPAKAAKAVKAAKPTKAAKPAKAAKPLKPALVPKPAPSRPVLSEVVTRRHRSPAVAASTLERLRIQLIEELAQHVRQAEGLQAEAEALANEREPGDTQFDEESGEGDTLSVERERDLALSASARQTVEDITKALARIDDGSYGYCEVCGDRIPVPRLEAIPWADQCVKCKSRGERRR